MEIKKIQKIIDVWIKNNTNGIKCDLRVISNSKLKSQIHDRWIISEGKSFNIPSPDIITRGQYSEIKETKNTLPFEEWWEGESRYNQRVE